MDEAVDSAKTQNDGRLSQVPPRHHSGTSNSTGSKWSRVSAKPKGMAQVKAANVIYDTGKPDAVKVARPVWRGVVGKGLAQDTTCDED